MYEETQGETSMKKVLKIYIDQLEKHDLLRVYTYVKRMQKGNSCKGCGRPLGNCRGHD
jgi:hypothetical protein